MSKVYRVHQLTREGAAHHLTHTVRKIDLILGSIELMPEMKFSMARKFTLLLLSRNDVKLLKNRTNLVFRLMCCLQETKQHRWGSNQ
jgi:uncharacterized Fe-S cluster-containing radical SAM superfamily protein